jgi:dihydroneopterin aldolase
MSDKVFVSGLELYCIIGIKPWEREVLQKVRIDLEMEADCRPAGRSDTVTDALDYRAVAKRVQSLVEGSSYQLVEALAENIAAVVLEEFPAAASVKVRVAKPGAVRWAESVGVEIHRTRGDSP